MKVSLVDPSLTFWLNRAVPGKKRPFDDSLSRNECRRNVQRCWYDGETNKCRPPPDGSFSALYSALRNCRQHGRNCLEAVADGEYARRRCSRPLALLVRRCWPLVL